MTNVNNIQLTRRFAPRLATRSSQVLEGRGRKVKGIANRHWVDLRLTPPPVKNKLRPYHALIFPNFSRADILSSSTTLPGHLIKLVKHCSPLKSLEGVAVDAMISREMALEGAEYLRDRGVCAGVRRVGLDSRFVVRRRYERRQRGGFVAVVPRIRII